MHTYLAVVHDTQGEPLFLDGRVERLEYVCHKGRQRHLQQTNQSERSARKKEQTRSTRMDPHLGHFKRHLALADLVEVEDVADDARGVVAGTTHVAHALCAQAGTGAQMR